MLPVSHRRPHPRLGRNLSKFRDQQWRMSQYIPVSVGMRYVSLLGTEHLSRPRTSGLVWRTQWRSSGSGRNLRGSGTVGFRPSNFSRSFPDSTASATTTTDPHLTFEPETPTKGIDYHTQTRFRV